MAESVGISYSLRLEISDGDFVLTYSTKFILNHQQLCTIGGGTIYNKIGIF
jgi:hypothetical protein